MVNNLFSTSGGLSFPVVCRKYGSQDKGISPEGAQDQLSFNVAFNIFDKPADFQAIEMLYPAKITATKDKRKVKFATRTKISILKNHVNGLGYEDGKILVTPHGFLKGKDQTEEKKSVLENTKHYQDNWKKYSQSIF